MTETTPSPLNNVITIEAMSGSRTTSSGWCGAAWRRR